MTAPQGHSLHEPPIVTADLAPAGGAIGPDPEDFVVDEVAAYSPSGSGAHLYVRVRKRTWTTPDMVHAVARAANVPPQDVGYAGLKDKHAVTTQWLSVPADRARAPEAWELPNGIEVLEATRHGNKIRTGHQRGNRFSIRLVGAPPGALARAEALCAQLRRHGLRNYFGMQRFGREGQNLPRALEWLRGARAARDHRSRFYRKLFPSVIQADVFNRHLTLRAAEGLERLLEGDVVRLEGSNAVFVVADPDAELPRLLRRDIHLTGPIVGPRMKEPAGAALELERHAVEAAGLTPDDLERLGRLVRGTRRDLVVWPEDLRVQDSGGDALTLDFFLPSGSYATQLVREITHGPYGAEARAGA